MANHKSAAKRARQTTRRNAVNTRRKSTVRTSEKGLLKALTDKNLKDLPQLLKDVTSEMMKAASKGALRKETVSRKIGRLSARVHQVLGTK